MPASRCLISYQVAVKHTEFIDLIDNFAFLVIPAHAGIQYRTDNYYLRYCLSVSYLNVVIGSLIK